MKKRSYRAQKVNEVGWEEMADRAEARQVDPPNEPLHAAEPPIGVPPCTGERRL